MFITAPKEDPGLAERQKIGGWRCHKCSWTNEAFAMLTCKNPICYMYCNPNILRMHSFCAQCPVLNKYRQHVAYPMQSDPPGNICYRWSDDSWPAWDPCELAFGGLTSWRRFPADGLGRRSIVRDDVCYGQPP